MIKEKRRATGFTLIEILVVVTIISILTAYVGISFSLISPRQIEAQARKLVSDLCWVRDMAVARHEDFVVDFDTANRSYSIYQNNITGNLIGRKVLDVDTVSIEPLPTNISFYYPKGTTTEFKQITLSYRGQSKQITVFNDTGYIKWQ